jgi:hypothetical protein
VPPGDGRSRGWGSECRGGLLTCRLSWKLEAWYWAYLAMVVWARVLSQRHIFLLPPSEDEEEDDEDEDEEDEDGDFTAGARSLPIPYRLVWMDEGSDGATYDQDPGSPPWGPPRGSVAEQPGPLDALEVLEEEQEGWDDTRW